jgi:hypothetical protein
MMQKSIKCVIGAFQGGLRSMNKVMMGRKQRGQKDSRNQGVSKAKISPPLNLVARTLLLELSKILGVSETRTVEIAIDLLFDKHRNSIPKIFIPGDRI